MPDPKLEKLKKLLEVANDGIGRADFEKAFAALVKFVKDLKLSLEDKNSQTVEELRTLINQLAQKLESFNMLTLGEIKSKVNIAMADQSKSLNYMRDWVRNIKNGADGKDADEELIVKKASFIAQKSLESKLLTIDQVEENLGKQGALIASALEALPEGEKLKIEAIEDLRKELDELRSMKTRGTFVGGGFNRSAMEQYFVDGEAPAEVPNDVIKDFLLLYTPSPASSLQVFKDGQLMKLTTDYTFSGLTVSFVDAPLTDSLILFYYRR